MAGGEEEDDYMADLSLFLVPEDYSSSTKKICSKDNKPTSFPKLKRPKTLNWMDKRMVEKGRKQREEDEHTKARLEAAIPESNIGFRMLRKMGYKPGTALGKEGVGIAVPVGLDIRRSRAGIGRESPLEAAERKQREAAERFRVSEEEMVANFGSRRRTQWREKKIASDYRKAEAALAQLDNIQILEARVEEEEEDDDKEKPGDEDQELVLTQEDLHEILIKLREGHCYCLYCGCQYESEGDLQSACPGMYEEDH